MSPRRWTGRREEYLATTADLIEHTEPWLRAFTAVDVDAARTAEVAPTAPLAGMPIAVKEIIDVAGWPITRGADTITDRVATTDAEPVRRLREAGAVVLGITTSTPFACGTTTVTANPVDPDRTPGGSSAGSGAAVGAGIVPVALASQSQASTLRPASYCGAWGYKPGHGRLPTEGMHRLTSTLDDLGLITASLGDLRAVCDVLWTSRSASGGPRDARLRVGVLRLDDGGLPRATTLAAFDEFVAGLRRHPTLAVSSGTAPLAAVDSLLAGSGATCFDIFAGEAAPVLAPWVNAGERDPRLTEMVEHARQATPRGLVLALQQRELLRGVWARLADHFDVLVSLATTNPAPLGHDSTGCRRMPATSSLLGIPALSVPWLTVEGLPQGVQLLGFDGRDEELLDAAAELAALIEPDHEEPR